MVYIYKAESTLFKNNYSLEFLLQFLPKQLHERALRYHFEKDAYDFVLGRLLLKEGLHFFGITDGLENIHIKEKGKPFIKDIHFNISHTKGMVICAISKDIKLGIDIEYPQKLDLSNFEAWFTAKEWATIQQSSDSLSTFYRYWTRKESIIKALGVDLSFLNKIELEVNTSSFELDGQQWYLQNIPINKNYHACICIDQVSEIQIKTFTKLKKA